MFNKEKVQKFINDFVEEALERHNIANPRQIEGRKFSTIEHELWKSLIYRGLVPRGTNNPQTSKALSVYNEIERMFRDSWNSLPTQEMQGESFKKSSKKLVVLHESSKRGMKKKHLNEGCACEGEETAPKHAEFISVDQVNRYMLQMTDEEQETMSFRDVIAGILGTKPENIKSMKRSGLGWKIEAEGNMDDNMDTLDNSEGAVEEEWADDEEDDWTDPEDDMEDWEREGYNSEIAYKNRWRDYED